MATRKAMVGMRIESTVLARGVTSLVATMGVMGAMGVMAGSAAAQDKVGGGAPAVVPAPSSSAAVAVDPAASSAPAVAPAPSPQVAQPGQPQPPPSGQPPPYGPPPSPLGRDFTFEANLGIGWLIASPDEGGSDVARGIGAPNLGIGGWVGPRTALTLRLASSTISESHDTVSISYTGGFLGGAIQHWVSEQAWVGAGVGLGFLVTVKSGGESDAKSESGLGLDLRAGLTSVLSGQHSLNFSFEVTPAFLDGITVTSVGLLLGYQYL